MHFGEYGMTTQHIMSVRCRKTLQKLSV